METSRMSKTASLFNSSEKARTILPMKLLIVMVAALLTTAQTKPAGGAKVPAALNFTMNSLDGKPVDLSKYQGNVVLMVNVASQCGFTPQYAGLETLHKKYASKGLRI